MPDIVSLKMLGVAGVASYAAARLATKVGIVGYKRFAIVSVPVAGMPAMPRGFEVRELTPEVLSQYVIDVPRSAQAERFAQGLSCLGAFNVRNELVGVTWVGTGPFTENVVHVRFHVHAGAAWDCGLWIAPQYRLGRGFAALWAGTGEWMRTHGKTRSVSWIVDHNLPSLLSHKRMGAVIVEHIMVFRFFHWQYLAKGTPKLAGIKRQPVDYRIPPRSSGIHETYGVITKG